MKRLFRRRSSTNRAPLVPRFAVSVNELDDVEEIEAAGQRELLASDALPRDCKGKQEEFEALGFTFGEPIDDLFQHATLPEGWQRISSGEAKWSYIVDERGLERVMIFFKAPLYAREAFMYITNPGHQWATRFIYGDGPDATPWDVMTEDERVRFIVDLESYLKRAEEHPDVYGDRVPRVRQRLGELTGRKRPDDS